MISLKPFKQRWELVLQDPDIFQVPHYVSELFLCSKNKKFCQKEIRLPKQTVHKTSINFVYSITRIVYNQRQII